MVPRSPVCVLWAMLTMVKPSLLSHPGDQRDCREAGGITQHIGASVIGEINDRKITFLDTPGHEAFRSCV